MNTCDRRDFSMNTKIRHVIIKPGTNNLVAIYDDCSMFVVEHRRFDGDFGGDIQIIALFFT
jgi:hypothetical protein